MAEELKPCRVCGKMVEERFGKKCWACYSTIEGV